MTCPHCRSTDCLIPTRLEEGGYSEPALRCLICGHYLPETMGTREIGGLVLHRVKS